MSISHEKETEMKQSNLFRYLSAWAAILAPILFALLVMIESVLRPGYSQISQNISDLGVGPFALLQNVNFILFGLLSLLFALGLGASLPATRTRAARWVVWLVTVFGIGIQCAGVSLLFIGVVSEQQVVAVHGLASFLAFFTIVAAQFVMGHALKDTGNAVWRRYRLYSTLSGFLSLALLVLLIATANTDDHGVTERTFVAVSWLWITITGIHLSAFPQVEVSSDFEEIPPPRRFALIRLAERLRFPQFMTREVALGGVCWLLSLEFFVGQAVAQSAWRMPYSLIDNPISDLGSTTCQIIHLGSSHRFVCSPWHVVMNASFILTGVLILLGLFFTRHAWPRRRLTTWGATFLVLAGLGKIVVGVAPENLNPTLHELGSVGIICGNLGLLFLGLAIKQARRWLAGVSLFLGSCGLLGVLLFVGQTGGRGATERVADYPLIVWMVVFGLCFIFQRQVDPDHKQLSFIQTREEVNQRSTRPFEKKGRADV